jgi:DNA-binding response OmpR family regulator
LENILSLNQFSGSPKLKRRWFVSSSADKNLFFLVVDDQFNVRRMVINFLRAHGFTKSAEAQNGQKAWEYLNAHGADFVICDWNMPVMNGVDFLRKVRADQFYRELPFLMVTAETAEEVVAECIEEGVDDYITKPFRADTLVGKIESILNKKANPSELDEALNKGANQLAQGKAQEALTEFEKALSLAPESPRANLSAGQAHEALGNEDKALKHYHASVNKAKRFVKAHDQLAALYAKRGDTKKACEHGLVAAKISPRNPNRQMDLGKNMLKAGNKEGALNAFKKAGEMAAHNPEISSEVGDLLLEAGMYEQAAEVFQNAVGQDPEQLHYYNRLGIALRKQKKFDQAIQQYLKALDVSPDNENIYFNMAVAHAEAGEYSLAKKTLGEALRIKPDFQEARTLYERLAKVQ